MEVCNNDYGEPPEGIPVWCVDLDTGWATWAQLVLELIFFVLLFMVVKRIKIWFIRRRRQKERDNQPSPPISIVSTDDGQLSASLNLYVPDTPHTSDSDPPDEP